MIISGNIVVSPAKSATHGSEVRIETSMEALFRKMELVVSDMIAKKFEVEYSHHDEEKRKLRTDIGQLQTDMGHLHRAYAIRNIEDWALKRMKLKLGMKADDEIAHSTLCSRSIRR